MAEVTDSYGPTHPITLANGTVVHGRVHVHTDYDEGAPNTGGGIAGVTDAYRLPTTVTTTVFDIETQADVSATADVSVQRYGYAAVAGMSKSGWELGVATTSVVQMGATASSSDLVTTTVYDVDGRILETRLPGNATGDAAGTSPRTTKFTYYTAAGSGACASAVSAGLVCKTAPGGQPTGNPLPTTVTVYDAYGNPTTSTETFTADGVAARARRLARRRPSTTPPAASPRPRSRPRTSPEAPRCRRSPMATARPPAGWPPSPPARARA